MAKQTKLEDNFFISPDEFINEFKEAEKKATEPLFFQGFKKIIYLDSPYTKNMEKVENYADLKKQVKLQSVKKPSIRYVYKIEKIDDIFFGTKSIIKTTLKSIKQYNSKRIQFLKTEADKYFNYPDRVLPKGLETELSPEQFYLAKEDFIEEFFKLAKKLKHPLIFPATSKIISLQSKSAILTLNCTLEEAHAVKWDIKKNIYSELIIFTKEETKSIFNFTQQTEEEFHLKLTNKKETFSISKEDFIQEFFKYAIEHKVGLVFKTGERVIDFSIKGTPSIRFKLDYTKEEAVGTKYLIYEKQESLPIVFTKEESMMYFNFLENPSQELTSIPKYKLSGASTQDNFKYEEHYPEYKIDFIEELIDLSKKKNTVVFFDEEKLLFTLEHKESKTTTIKLIIEYTSEEAVGQRYVNEEADYRAVFSKSESQSHLFFMNVGLNLANKLIK